MQQSLGLYSCSRQSVRWVDGMSLILKPGILSVASAYPDPPFELADGSENGFDIDLMRATCAHLGLQLQRQRYLADNFDDIFDGLKSGTCDAVISGTTITTDRAAIVQFSEPYLEFNQGVAVNPERTPKASSESDLHGLTAGIQVGNTSDFVARRWVAAGVIAGIRYYPYDGIQTALSDLEAGSIGLVIKLLPVISWLIKSRPKLAVSMQVPTHEQLGIAFAKDNTKLCDAVNGVLHALHNDGEFEKLKARWFAK
jgi:ABC-type amino acid transport substrate-binding protein